MSHRLAPVFHDYGDVTETASPGLRTATGAGAEAVESRAFVSEGVLDPQLICYELEVVLCVCRRRAHDLLDLARYRHGEVAQNRDGLVYAAALERVENQTHLARSD